MELAQLIREENGVETVIFSGKPSQVAKYFVRLQTTMFVLGKRHYRTVLPKTSGIILHNGREFIFNGPALPIYEELDDAPLNTFFITDYDTLHPWPKVGAFHSQTIDLRNLIDLSNYWLTLNILARDARLAAMKQADLEEEAFDLELIVYQGKLIAPSNYPCLCSKESPDACFEDDAWMCSYYAWTPDEKHDKQCHCPCHQYWWPD